MSEQTIAGKIFNQRYLNMTNNLVTTTSDPRELLLQSNSITVPAKALMSDQRRAIIVSTIFGNCIIYDRYPNQTTGGEYLVEYPVRKTLDYLIGHNPISGSIMVLLTTGEINTVLNDISKDFI